MTQARLFLDSFSKSIICLSSALDSYAFTSFCYLLCRCIYKHNNLSYLCLFSSMILSLALTMQMIDIIYTVTQILIEYVIHHIYTYIYRRVPHDRSCLVVVNLLLGPLCATCKTSWNSYFHRLLWRFAWSVVVACRIFVSTNSHTQKINCRKVYLHVLKCFTRALGKATLIRYHFKCLCYSSHYHWSGKIITKK